MSPFDFDVVFVLAHDGVFSLQTGAGVSNCRFIRCLIRLGLGPRLHVGAVETARSSPDFAGSWYHRIRRHLRSHGATVTVISNGTSGRVRYGTSTEWRYASAAAARWIRSASRGLRSLVISFDSPFVPLIAELDGREGLTHVHVPRSTGLLHQPEDLARGQLEASMLRMISGRTTFVGAISAFMRTHLIEDLGVPDGRMIDLHNGVLRGERWPGVRSTQVGDVLDAVGLKGGESFVLCSARAVAYKGLHLLIQALAAMADPPACVMWATAGAGDRNYLVKLRGLWNQHQIRGKLFTTFDVITPRVLQGADQLIAVVVPSLAEPAGLIPMECHSNPRCRCPVVASEVGGLTEQVFDGVTGLTFPPGNVGGLASCIRQASRMTQRQRRKMKSNALTLVRERFDYLENTRGFLARV